MSKRFMISDLHFDHIKMVEYRGFNSVEDMNAALIAGWQSRVTFSDRVYVLGDVALNTTPESLDRHLSQLPGTKVLIMGNHDTAPAKIEAYQWHFSALVGCMEYKGCILSHIPVHPAQLSRFRFNIHGHVHKNSIRLNDDLSGELDMRYINVSCEVLNFVPKTFEELIANRGANNEQREAGETEAATRSDA